MISGPGPDARPRRAAMALRDAFSDRAHGAEGRRWPHWMASAVKELPPVSGLTQADNNAQSVV